MLDRGHGSIVRPTGQFPAASTRRNVTGGTGGTGDTGDLRGPGTGVVVGPPQRPRYVGAAAREAPVDDGHAGGAPCPAVRYGARPVTRA
jgi:hypothetical protein